MFFGCISIYGPGCLIPIHGTMNSDIYIETIKHEVLPIANAWFGRHPWILQQDNARCHTSRKTMKAFDEMGINVLSWPSSSPDLNCIENVWGSFKKKVRQRIREAHDRHSLITLCRDIWNNDVSLISVCHNNVQSMPERLFKLKKAKGGYTGY